MPPAAMLHASPAAGSKTGMGASLHESVCTCGGFCEGRRQAMPTQARALPQRFTAATKGGTATSGVSPHHDSGRRVSDIRRRDVDELDRMDSSSCESESESVHTRDGRRETETDKRTLHDSLASGSITRRDSRSLAGELKVCLRAMYFCSGSSIPRSADVRSESNRGRARWQANGLDSRLSLLLLAANRPRLTRRKNTLQKHPFREIERGTAATATIVVVSRFLRR